MADSSTISQPTSDESPTAENGDAAGDQEAESPSPHAQSETVLQAQSPPESSTTDAVPVDDSSPLAAFGLTSRDQLVLAVLAVVTVGLMLVHWARLSGWGTEPVEIERLEAETLNYKIDINTATWVEWVQLEGIGETLAERIIRDREQNGPFESIDDLQRVKGIGPKTVAKIRKHLTVGRGDKAAPKQ